MVDSAAKIQQAVSTNEQNAWAFFSRPMDSDWNFISGIEKEIVGNNPNLLTHETGVENLGSGFYFRGFSQESLLYCIEGNKNFCATTQLGVALEGCLSKTDLDNMVGPNHTTDKMAFEREIESIQQAIKSNEFVKLVAARKQTWAVTGLDALSLRMILLELKSLFPKNFIFLLYSPTQGCWLGASPEQLLTVNKGMANVMALAGTLTENQLLWTEKERQEQRVTHDFIGEILLSGKYSATESNSQEVVLGKVRHLLREWNFNMPFQQWFSLIDQLHPTPAVGGYPQRSAQSWIVNHETFERKLYSGWLGYVSVEEESVDVYVTLRCAQLYANAIACYAGCGINLMSDTAVEWNETVYKMAMLVDVVGKHLSLEQMPT